ncbi:MAG TPA: methyl-accepting chemotaxis protein, partial [Methanothermococcus okinawensis]|nr:methyl-accepting chemotaxis protein [Methanothermococcus okinawensis]
MDKKVLLLGILSIPPIIISIMLFILAPTIMENMIMYLIGGIIISVGISYFIANKTFQKLCQCNELLEKIFEILEVDISEINDSEKISELLNQIEKLKNSNDELNKYKREIRRTISEIIDALNKLNTGDLTVRMDENRKYNKLQKTFNSAIENIANLIDELRDHVKRLDDEINTLRTESERAKEISD